jgi:type III restriction enzyme
MKSDSISLRVERFMDFLTYNNDLMMINDEAHHVHNTTDSELKRWQESIEILRNRMEENENSLFFQYDFTATPFTIKGKKKEFFSHVIYDYGLVEAMQNMLVKQIFIEKSSFLSNKIEQLPDSERLLITAHKDEAKKVIELSEVQKHMIDVGLAKLEHLQKDFDALKINKKPVMFVMADNNDEADVITEYIKEKKDLKGSPLGDDSRGEQVVTIHTKKKDALSDEDYKKLKNTVFASDDASNPARVIVSVLMLREGFDVKNVCVLVVLRRSDSDLLTEQVIGRGIRLMFPEPEYQQDKINNYNKILNKEKLINAYDLLFVVEHPKFNDIYEQLTKAGAQIASGSSIEISLDSKSVLIHIDEERISEYDISWPISLTYKTEEDLDFSQFDISKLPLSPQPFEDIYPNRVLITDYHPTTQFRSEWELLDANFTYGGFIRSTVREIIGSRKDSRMSLSRYAPEIAEIIDIYVSKHLFGRKIDFSIEENVEKLRNQQLVYFITNKVREAINKFLQHSKSHDVIEAEWTQLSKFKELKIRMERSIETKKCVYPYLDFPYKGGLERNFVVDILENDPSVLSYVKLNQYLHKFSIPYINSMGYLVPYYPDFIVKTEDAMYIIETKSANDAKNDIDVKRKAITAEQRCREMSKIKTIPPVVQPREWRYALIPQDIFEAMESSGFNSLIERCESNLAFLKISRE